MLLRARPRFWVWGLFPLLLVGLVGVYFTQRHIERDLERRSVQALLEEGISWAKPEFQGLNGVLNGKAPSEDDLTKATAIVRDVWGVHKVLNNSSLLPKFSPFVWSAYHKDGRVRLDGHVPSYKLKKTITGLVKAKFPKVELVDQLKVGRGVDDADRWFGQVSYGLSQLARLDHGRVSLTDGRFDLSGPAANEVGFKALLAAYNAQLPLELTRGSIEILPPKVANYVFSARYDDAVVVLEGVVPTDVMGKKLADVAGAYFPNKTIQNKFTLGSGAPFGWEKALQLTLAELSKLKSGVGVVQGQDVRFEGIAESDETAKAIRLKLRSNYPTGYKVSDVITVLAPKVVKVKDPLQKAPEKEQEAEPILTEPEVKSAEELAKQRNWLSPAETETRLRDIHKERGAVSAKECQLLMNSIVRGSAIRFAVDRADIQASSYGVLKKVQTVADKCTNTIIRVEGHTDSDGAADYNLALSKKRARAVIDYLNDKGVPLSRMDAKGFGENKPVASNQTTQGKALNRRIEFVVFEN